MNSCTEKINNKINAKDVIIACDFPTAEATFEFLDRLGEARPFLKIGMELYYAAGAEMVKRLKERGHKIFLDLKLHDIPNTVSRAMRVLSNLDVDMVNVHAAGGSAMMKAAIEGLTRPDGSRPLLIAVTQLTSTSSDMLHNELLIPEEMPEVVEAYARNAKASGLDGIVCSPREVVTVKTALGDEFMTVTPGIRFADSKADDQVRVTTPRQARESGSDYIVVGRPITAAPNPEEAYYRCVKEFLTDEAI